MSTAVVSKATAKDIGRDAARALNETALLREALIREVRALGALYVIGRRRPITELTPEQQEKVREAYRDTLWASDYCVDMMGVCTSKALAEQFCKERGPNWFYTKLPIDSVLGEEPVFGDWAHQFPGSDATTLYENMQSATTAVLVSDWRMINEELERLRAQVRAGRAALDP